MTGVASGQLSTSAWLRRWAGLALQTIIAYRRWVVAIAAGLVLVGIAVLLATRNTEVPVVTSRINHAEGYSYSVRFKWWIVGDSFKQPNRSGYVLYEDDRSLGPAHAAHPEIAESGLGRYSHWRRGLYFSSSDQTDPRTNGRHYSLRGPNWYGQLIGTVLSALGGTIALAMGMLWHGTAPAVMRRRRDVALRLGQVLAPLGLAVVLFAPTLRMPIPVADMRPLQGHAYVVNVPQMPHPGDTIHATQRSRLALLEDGNPVGPAHAPQSDIVAKGGGRFSHWGHDLLFSASDNSDPRSNGRSYGILVPDDRMRRLGWLATALGCAGLIFGATGSSAVDQARRRRAIATLGAYGGLCGVVGMIGLFGAANVQPPSSNGWDLISAMVIAVRGRADLMVIFGFVTMAAILGESRAGWRGVRWGGFIGACAAVVAVVNGVLLGGGDFWVVLVPDSMSYMSLNACRTPGYLAFLTPFFSIDPRWLVAVQLNLLLAALVTVATGVAFVTRSVVAGTAALLLGVLFGDQLNYAFGVLTETPFTAAFGLALGAALLYLRFRHTWLAAAVGLGAAMAIAVKASAPVLIASAGLLVLLPAPRRRLNGVLAIGLPLACLLVLIGIGRWSHGSWSPTNFMGAALVGHVAYGIRGDELASDKELSSALEERLRPFYEKWPPITDLDAYVDATINDYNAMLYLQILPTVVKTRLPKTPSVCTKEFNSLLMTLSREAILRFPGGYVGHALAHYYGLWSFALYPYPMEYIASAQRRFSVTAFENPAYAILPSVWQPSPAQISALLAGAARADAVRPSLSMPLYRMDSDGLVRWIAIALGIVATCAVFLSPFLGRLRIDVAALVICAAFIVPYYAIHSLFQVALLRYTSGVQIGIGAFAALFFFVLFDRLRVVLPPLPPGWRKRSIAALHDDVEDERAVGPGSQEYSSVRDLTRERDKTIRDFGDQWTRNQASTGYYASLDLLDDIIQPFLSRQDIAGKNCAEIGSGTGRIVRMLLDAGARHVTAVEPSRAYDVLVRNTADAADRVTCLNRRGDEIPAAGFAIVLSIGVIHHIPDPRPVVEAAFRALAPGGALLVWVYGHEGSALYRAIFQPVRLVTRRLPEWVNEGIAWVIYPFVVAYGRIAGALPFMPLARYLTNVYMQFDPPTRRLVIVDQINPRWAKYYRRDEIERLLRECGFVDVKSHNRHGYSWTAIGRKPVEEGTR